MPCVVVPLLGQFNRGAGACEDRFIVRESGGGGLLGTGSCCGFYLIPVILFLRLTRMHRGHRRQATIFRNRLSRKEDRLITRLRREGLCSAGFLRTRSSRSRRRNC